MKKLISNIICTIIVIFIGIVIVIFSPKFYYNYTRRCVRFELQDFNRNAITDYQDSVTTIVYDFLDKLYKNDEYLYEDVISQWEETDKLYKILEKR